MPKTLEQLERLGRLSLDMKLAAVEALTDLLDGCKGPHEIHENTGLPDERCKEIWDLHCVLMKELVG